MATKISPVLEQLAAEIGGEIKPDGELYYGPSDHQIFISAQDEGGFFLASQHPLYSIKNGKARRVRVGTKGDDAGWYYATVSAEQVRTALDLALGIADGKEHTVEFAYEHILCDYCAHHLSAVSDELAAIVAAEVGRRCCAGDRLPPGPCRCRLP